jgi:hypothetical protein
VFGTPQSELPHDSREFCAKLLTECWAPGTVDLEFKCGDLGEKSLELFVASLAVYT